MPKKYSQRKDGRYRTKIYLGKDNVGKSKYKYLYANSEKELMKKEQEVRLSLHKGIDIQNRNDTFEKWAKFWLMTKEAEISLSQKNVYKSMIKHLNNKLAFISISKIKTYDIQACISTLAKNNPNTGKPSSKQTLKVLKMTACQIFQYAIDNRIIDFNPASPVKIPTNAPSYKRRALTKEEQQWIIEMPHRAKRAAMIMMYAGLRRGEVIALTWNDIDLENATINVNKAVIKHNAKFVLKPTTKTEAGMRVVDIPEILVNFLRNEKHESEFVCVNVKNNMHTESSWRRMWSSYLTDLNFTYGDFSAYEKTTKSKFDPNGVPFVIDNIGAHWLRHTYATMLYLSGVDALTAKEQLGHSDIKTTLNIYTHLDSNFKRKSMNKLDSYINTQIDN